MAQLEFRLPSLGMSMEEGTIAEWLVAVGDTIHEGQEIVVVGTDKVDTALPTPYAGTISALHAEVGQTIEVGALLATIDT